MRLATPLWPQFLERATLPAGTGCCISGGKIPRVLLDGGILLGKLHFLYGDLATNRSVGSRSRFRLPAARSGLLLWPLLARPLRGKTSQRHRSARSCACKMAQRSGTRAGASRHFHPHGGISQARTSDLRYSGRFRRSQPSRTVSAAQNQLSSCLI
jgi:hypothetical protein